MRLKRLFLQLPMSVEITAFQNSPFIGSLQLRVCVVVLCPTVVCFRLDIKVSFSNASVSHLMIESQALTFPEA